MRNTQPHSIVSVLGAGEAFALPIAFPGIEAGYVFDFEISVGYTGTAGDTLRSKRCKVLPLIGGKSF
jgi:hypothetical protein